MARGLRVMWALAALAVLLAGAAVAQEFTELTEARALEIFATSSPHTLIQRARVAQIAAETRARALHPNPSANYTREGAGLTEFAYVEQPVVLSGRLSHLRQASAAAVHAAGLSAQRSLWLLRSEVRLLFYALLAAQERLALVQSAESDLAEVIRILRQREAGGEGSKFDRLRGERELTELAAELLASRAAVNENRGRLAALLGTDLAADTRMAGILFSTTPLPSLDHFLTRAFIARGDFTAEKHALERYRHEELAAERLRIPDPSIQVGIKRADVGGRMRSGSVLAISVPLPLFNRSQVEAARARAEAEQSQARTRLLELQVRTDVTTAYRNMELRLAATDAYGREATQRGAELIRIARVAYQEGETGILDLLDVYRSSRQAQLRLLELQAAAREAEIELERAVGEEVKP